MQGLGLALTLLLLGPVYFASLDHPVHVAQQGSLRFSGTVTDDLQQPIAGAEILIFAPSMGQQIRGRSDSKGRVNIIIPDMGEPRYYVVASKNGYIQDKSVFSARELEADGFQLELQLLRE